MICIVLPQAFTTEFRVHWGQHLLRPEFAESTYYLYKVIGLNSSYYDAIMLKNKQTEELKVTAIDTH